MDKLELQYIDIVKKFDSWSFKRFNPPKALKELGDLLKYRRMKKTLDGLDIDQMAGDLIKELNELVADLNKI